MHSVNFRRRVERLVLLLVGAIFFQTWFIAGLPIPCTVAGSSMATTLLGEHFTCRCPTCQAAIVCNAHSPDDVFQASCGNCGRPIPSEPEPALLSGERVLIDRSAYAVRGPQRWDVAAFTRADMPDLIVKRIIGLPGETIEIRHGNVYADGQLQRKNLRQQRAMRVMVHDASNVPDFARWRSTGDRSDWGFFEGRWTHAEGPKTAKVDWLNYHHPARWQSDRRSPDGPITDVCYYNQGRPRLDEDIHEVEDVMLAVRISEIDGNGLLWLALNSGASEYRLKIDPAHGEYAAFDGQKPLAGGEGRLPSAVRNATLEFSIFDQQFLIACNGQTLACIDLPEQDAAVRHAAPKPDRQPLAIGAQGLHLVFDSIQVYRNIYYTPAASGNIDQGQKPVKLGGNEYFMLGDNSSVSDDSRTWSQPAISGRDIVGRPLIVLYSPCEISCFGGYFQVPDLTRIRYIR